MHLWPRLKVWMHFPLVLSAHGRKSLKHPVRHHVKASVSQGIWKYVIFWYYVKGLEYPWLAATEEAVKAGTTLRIFHVLIFVYGDAHWAPGDLQQPL